jgi:geranylgeranyl pyrophosphate synthase
MTVGDLRAAPTLTSALDGLDQPFASISNGLADIASGPGQSAFPIAARLAASYDSVVQRLDAAAAADAPIVSQAVSYFMSHKGKLLRPTLVLLASEIAGGDPGKVAGLATAVELVHCSSIILDDLPCMDNSDTRRGQSSLHIRFGEAAAILTSVHFLSRAFQLVAESSMELKKDLTSVLSDAISQNGMIRGQIIDLSSGGDADEVRSLKTGALFRVAVQFGALAANASAPCVHALVQYASSLSVAYQIFDDVRDKQAHRSHLPRAIEIGSLAVKQIFEIFGENAASRDLAGLFDFSAAHVG